MNTIDWLTEKEAAEMLRISLATLRRWRRRREGPPWFRIGRVPRYQREDVERFIEQQRQS